METLVQSSFKVSIYLEEGIVFFPKTILIFYNFGFPKYSVLLFFFKENFAREWLNMMKAIHQKIATIKPLEEGLKPTDSTFRLTQLWRDYLLPGYHIAVYCSFKKLYHHGIFINADGKQNVIHCNMTHPSIQYCSIHEFFDNYPVFCIVQHEYYNLPGHNDATVEFAKCFVELPPTHLFQKYNLLNWNCECFAMACVSRGFITHSEQIQRVWDELNSKLSKQQSIVIMGLLASFAHSG